MESPQAAARRTLIEALEAARYLADQIARGPGGREVALTITKLQEALHWLREVEGV